MERTDVLAIAIVVSPSFKKITFFYATEVVISARRVPLLEIRIKF